MKKTLALILALLMLVAVLAACNGDDKPADTTTPDVGETTPAPETTTPAPETTTPAPVETTTPEPVETTTEPVETTTEPAPEIRIPPVAEGLMVYYQDFESVGVTNDNDAAMAAIGWTIQNNYTTNSVKYSTLNGVLTADNISGNDSYALIVDEAWMAPAATGSYTVQFDMKHVEVGQGDRYVALLTNYVPTEEGSYFSFHLRCCGYADYQPRINGGWNGRFDEGSEFDASNKAEGAIVKRVLGIDYTDKNATHFLGKPLTVRIQLNITAGPTIWIRDNSAANPQFVKVSECTMTDKWEARRGNALALKVSKLIKAEIDNVAVWTGLGEMPTDTTDAAYRANIQSYLDAIKK